MLNLKYLVFYVYFHTLPTSGIYGTGRAIPLSGSRLVMQGSLLQCFDCAIIMARPGTSELSRPANGMRSP
jgi:hypothetical protein